MIWMLGDHLGNAYQSLRRSRMRTFLTTLGVAIGVASVTAILALSSGLSGVINDQLQKLGGNLIVVRPGTTALSISGAVSGQNYTTSTLSEKDVSDIKALPGVSAVAPIMTSAATLKTDTRSLPNTVVVATTPDLATISKLTARDGQFIDDQTSDHAAILGHQLAVDLFGTEKPIGLTFTTRGERFTVVGVLSANFDPINYNQIDFDNAAIINFSVGKIINQGRVQIQQIDVRASTASGLNGVADQIGGVVAANHSGERDFTVASGRAVSAATVDTMRAMTTVMAAVAGISLVVGGVGIMNIMLVGVAERTREIGIRKSVGATSSSVAWQFMLESIMLSLTGGFLGYLLGYVVAFGVSTFLYFVPSVNWQVAGVALGMALTVGVVFGLYPSLRAARKHPIESLRQYH